MGLDIIISRTEKQTFIAIKFYRQIISKNQINFDKGVTKVLFQSIMWEQTFYYTL